jgi:hypothetical protein
LVCGDNISNNCTLNCSSTASCRIDCGTHGNNCQLNNCPVTVTNCPNSTVKVCGRTCS